MSCAARRLTTIQSDCSSARKKALRRAHGNCVTARDARAGDLKPADFGSNERAAPIEAQNEQLRQELNELRERDDLLATQISSSRVISEGQQAAVAEDPKAFSAKWNNGFEAATKDKRFKYHVGGRVQFDTVFLAGDSQAFNGTGPFTDQDAVGFRRARLRADGTMYETIDWCAEFDFVNSVNDNLPSPPSETTIIGVPAPTDLWVTFREVPVVGNVRVGDVKEPIGFEHLTSSRYLDFMERSYNQDIFYGAYNNGFTPGVVVYDTWADELGTWSTGFFKNNTKICNKFFFNDLFNFIIVCLLFYVCIYN
jgi:phosphate-selective porin OprO/OprP